MAKETTPLVRKHHRQPKEEEDEEEDDDVDYWYGRNDLHPLPLRKRICIYVTLVLLSPLILILFVFYVLFVFIVLIFTPTNENQKKTAKYMGFEAWYRVPGKKLEIIETPSNNNGKGKNDDGVTSFDILIPNDFVNDEKTKLDSCKYLSLRKSIEYTVKTHLRQGPYGTDIFEKDNDRDEPHYLLHGWSSKYDPNGDELWCTHARTATWAAIYSWTNQLKGGEGSFLQFFNPSAWDQAIDLKTAPDVFGYIYLFQVTNPDFYKTQPRIVRVGNLQANSPHTPETDGKIFVRYGYSKVKMMGDFPNGDPDAYIFKGKVLQEAKLKILHQYRIMKLSSSS